MTHFINARKLTGRVCFSESPDEIRYYTTYDEFKFVLSKLDHNKYEIVLCEVCILCTTVHRWFANCDSSGCINWLNYKGACVTFSYKLMRQKLRCTKSLVFLQEARIERAI